MILVYFLPVETIDGTEQVAGIEFIHDALLECTEEPDVRKLTQDTTQEEHDGLFIVATDIREPTQLELERFHAEVIPFVPDPDTIRAEEILHNPTIPIPAPDLAELVRIFGRRLGYHF